MRQQCVLTPKKANGMLCWISRNTAVRLRDLVLSLFSPLMRLHLKYCCPVLGSLVQEVCGCSGCKPIKGSGGGWQLEHTTLEEKLREQDLFRSEAVGNWDLNALQPPKWEVTEKTETDCPLWRVVIGWESNRHKLQHGKFHLSRRNKFFTMNVPDIGTGAQRSSEISFLGGIQNLTGQTLASWSKLALLGCWERSLQRFLPT